MSTCAYIAGPMTGQPDFNYPAFHAVATTLRAEHPDWDVINPAEKFDGDRSLPWQTYLRAAIQQVAAADVIVLMPGWWRSKGARLELDVALGLGLEVIVL